MEENITAVEQEAQVTETTEETTPAETQERTFTQEEVNKIVADRLKRESAKNSEALANSTNDLAEATKKASDLEAELVL